MAITAALEPAHLAVDPGQSVSCDIRLRNDGPVDARLSLAVTGPARPYSWVAPETITVAAGSDGVARVGFHAPRSSVPAAGPLAFDVVVSHPQDGTVTVPGVVEVKPFSVLSATLLPDPDDPAQHTVSIGNRGNAPMPTVLRGEADSDTLTVRVHPTSVVVSPEGRASAVVHVMAAAGASPAPVFRVVAEPEVGDRVTVEGRAHVPPPPKRRRRALVAGIVVAAVALVAAGLALASGGGKSNEGAKGSAEDVIPAGGAPLDACPGKGHTDAYGVRSLTPSEIANLPNTYTFMRLKADGCTPIRFNPCEPVHFVQNAAAAPPFAAENVREAFRRLARATGITFVDDGLTDETARAGPFVPDRYGARWAPILILWEHFPPEQTSGRQQILGQTAVFRAQDVVVSGRLRFNVDAYNDEVTKAPIEAGFGPPAGSGTGPIGRENITWGRIVLHELAHVVGLGHTRDFGSLMYPDAAQQAVRPADFARPDLEGLRYLGKEAGCVSNPPLPAA